MLSQSPLELLSLLFDCIEKLFFHRWIVDLREINRFPILSSMDLGSQVYSPNIVGISYFVCLYVLMHISWMFALFVFFRVRRFDNSSQMVKSLLSGTSMVFPKAFKKSSSILSLARLAEALAAMESNGSSPWNRFCGWWCGVQSSRSGKWCASTTRVLLTVGRATTGDRSTGEVNLATGLTAWAADGWWWGKLSLWI